MKLLTCTKSLNCEYAFTSCSYTPATSDLSITFTLTQTKNLADKSILDRDVEAMKNEDKPFELQVNTARKRAVISIKGVKYEKSVTKTGCPANSIELNNECSVCPPGYGLNAAKDACVLCGYGSWSTGGFVPCTPCVNPSLTTQLRGSTTVFSCVPKTDICVVGGEPSLHGNLVPPKGSRVLQTTTVTGVCPTGSNQQYGVSDKFLCNLKSYPTCHGKKCSQYVISKH